jgi:hypothetical protein
MASPLGKAPKAVIEIVRGPAVVSLPMRGHKYSSAIAKRPLENASNYTLSTVGRAIASVNPMGLALMAARSERLTARAFRPNSSGLAPVKNACLQPECHW